MKDLDFMQRAVELARRGVGLTSPNPCVGAVLVQSGKIIGEGWHRQAGGPHAEVNAVRDARRRKNRIAGATLYVTLEPCCTHGRTPPCTELIIREKIKRVVVAATDPNPCHAGRGFRLLRRAGIAVTTGVAVREAQALNRAFNHWIIHQQPWVIGKIAMSLDGRIAVRPGDDRWLTGLSSRRYVHHLRAESDAIIIGAATARKDNPALTVRSSAYPRKRQPWRVILTRSGKLSRNLQIFNDEHRDRTLVYRNQSMRNVLNDLGKREVTCALIEGGGEVLGQALAEGLVHEIVFFLAPVILGSTGTGIIIPKRRKGIVVSDLSYQRIGQDLLCRSIIAPNLA